MLVVFSSFLLGVAFTTFGVWLLFKRKILAASLNTAAGCSLLSISIIVALIFLNVHTYNRLTSEQLLAVIEVGLSTDTGIPVTVQTDEMQRVFILNSREWQMDARFLKWKSWAYLLGSEPVVRLENFAERYPLPQGSQSARYSLLDDIPVLAELGSSLSDWFGIVDSYYGSAVYMPVAEGATYRVSASVSGLIARADNKPAQNAVTEWMSQ